MTRQIFAVISFVIIITSIAVFSTAQVHTFISPNSVPNGQFGPAIGIDDVNLDSVGDILITAVGENSYAGRAYIFSGQDFSLIRTLTSPNSESGGFFGVFPQLSLFESGWSVMRVLIGAPGETVSGTPGAGRLYIVDPYDGNTSTSLVSPSPTSSGQFGFGISIEDITGSDYLTPDLIVGAPGEGTGGRAYIISGWDFSVVQTLTSPNAISGGLFGIPFLIPDLNGDGTDDFAISAQLEEVSGQGYAGRVYVYSGATRSVLYTLVSPNPESYGSFGVSVAVLDDITADGKAELFIGSFESTGSIFQTGTGYLFSGASGALLNTFSPSFPVNGGQYGSFATTLPDLNEDAVPDFAFTELWSQKLLIFSGATRTQMATLTRPDAACFDFGFPYVIPDLNGDSVKELIVADTGYGSNAGRSYLYSSTPNISASPSSLFFGNRPPGLGPGYEKLASVTNTGLLPIHLTGAQAEITGTDATDFLVSTAPTSTTVFFAATSSVGAKFNPTSYGLRSANLTISSDDPTTPQLDIPLSGVGHTFPSGAVSGTVYMVLADKVFAIDIATGNRSILSSSTVGSGPVMGLLTGITIENSNSLLVAGSASLGSLFRVNRTTGDRALITAIPSGGIPAPGLPRGLALENSNSVVVGLGMDGIARVNLQTTARSYISNFSIGSGTFFSTPFDVAVESDGTILVADVSVLRLLRVDPTSGNRTVFLQGSDGLPPPCNIELLSNGDVIVATAGYDQVTYVFGSTGWIYNLSGAGIGSGPTMHVGRAVGVGSGDAIFVYDPLFTLDNTVGAILRIDPNTGDRTLISTADPLGPVGSGPAFTGSLTFADPVYMSVESSMAPTAADSHWTLYQ
ncbi:MAG: hypothetical protein V2A74_06540 [bacterium]